MDILEAGFRSMKHNHHDDSIIDETNKKLQDFLPFKFWLFWVFLTGWFTNFRKIFSCLSYFFVTAKIKLFGSPFSSATFVLCQGECKNMLRWRSCWVRSSKLVESFYGQSQRVKVSSTTFFHALSLILKWSTEAIEYLIFWRKYMCYQPLEI